MKNCKNKFILLLVLVLTCVALFSVAGCSGVGGVVVPWPEDDPFDNDDENIKDDLGHFWGVPQQFVLNGITYDDSNMQYYELDELIGYCVNREDYQSYYEENPDVAYFIDEKNEIYTSDGYNRFAIYSIKGRDVEQNVVLYSMDRVVNSYVNNSYMEGD